MEQPDNIVLCNEGDGQRVLEADASAQKMSPVVLSRLDLLAMVRGQKSKGKIYRLANLGKLKADFFTPNGQPFYLASRIEEIDRIMQEEN